MEFTGTFRDEGKQVILEGSFCIPFNVKLWYSLLYALVILIVAWSVYEFIVDHNQGAAGFLLFALGMAWWGCFIAKIKTEDSASDWKWLTASINGALVVFNTTPENDSPSATVKDETRRRNP